MISQRWKALRIVPLFALVAIWSALGCGGSRDSASAGGTSGGGSANSNGNSNGGGNGGKTDAAGNVVTEPGFTSLFDGRNLSGWTYGKDSLEGQTATSDMRFQVQNGVIVASGKAGKGGAQELVTSRTFNKDFILKLEFKASQEGHGVLSVRDHNVSVSDFIRRGEQKQLQYFKNDGWNEMQIVVRLTTHVHGKALSETDQLEASFRNGKATATLNGQSIDPNAIGVRVHGHPKCNGENLRGGGFPLVSSGRIGFRSVSGKIEFRNIRFQELP